MTEKPWTRFVAPVGLVAAGVVAGGVLAASLTASAETTPSPSTSSGATTEDSSRMHADGNPAHSQRADEKLLSGDTATKVRAAALAKYPGATIERVESDSDGVYEAHLVTAAGEHLAIEVDKDFKVTGTEAHGPGGPGGHHGHHGGANHNDADDAATTGSNA